VPRTAQPRAEAAALAVARPRLAVRTPFAHLAPVVVIGLDSITGLHTARILAGYGVSVIGVARNSTHPCCRTNVCDRVLTADTTGPRLIAALIRLGRTLAERAVLIPCTDLSVLLTSRHRDALAPWFHFSLPAADVVEMLVDKASFYAFAQREGLPIPPTFILRSPGDAEAAARALNFPVVLKPAVKTPEWERSASAKAYRASSAEELLRLARRCAEWSDCLIAQEWIPGVDSDHYTCNCYFSTDSEPLVTFTTRKLRQWPPFGGEACLSEENDNPSVVHETLALFGKVNLRGLGYLEVKRDARTGEHLIIEPNIGRPTGRSAAAEAAGVELLYTLYCDLLGHPLPAHRKQTYRGVKWIHARRDFQSALYHWWRGELTASEWLRSLRGRKTEALFSWRDPLPFWADIARVALDFRGKRQRRSAHGD
jgi:D-aspartate ligase